MKKLVLMLCMVLICGTISPVYASETHNEIDVEFQDLMPFGGTKYYVSSSIGNNGRLNFKNSGDGFWVSGSISFSCTLNSSAKIKISYYNIATGTSTTLYTGTTSSKTVSTYVPGTYGYIYITNLSGGTITVSSASVTY